MLSSANTSAFRWGHRRVPSLRNVPAGDASARALSAAWPGICPARSGARGAHCEPLQINRVTSMMFNRDDPNSWPCFRPLIIAHDVGHRRDRSTAVVGGLSPFEPRLIGIKEAEELPQGLYGSARASALAIVDRRYHSDAVIVADLSNDATYAEVLFDTFGPSRVIRIRSVGMATA